MGKGRLGMKGTREFIDLLVDAAKRGGYVKGEIWPESGSISVVFPDEIPENDAILERLQVYRNDLVSLVRASDRGD
jgi:hypothetical protein